MMKKENGVRVTENKETVLVDVSEVGRKWSDRWWLCGCVTPAPPTPLPKGGVVLGEDGVNEDGGGGRAGKSCESSLIEFGEFFSLGFKVTEMVMDKKEKKNLFAVKSFDLPSEATVVPFDVIYLNSKQ